MKNLTNDIENEFKYLLTSEQDFKQALRDVDDILLIDCITNIKPDPPVSFPVVVHFYLVNTRHETYLDAFYTYPEDFQE